MSCCPLPHFATPGPRPQSTRTLGASVSPRTNNVSLGPQATFSMDEFGDEASAILMMSHAPRAHELASNVEQANARTVARRAGARQDRAAAAKAAEARKAERQALRAGMAKANSIRRRAAEEAQASKRREARARVPPREQVKAGKASPRSARAEKGPQAGSTHSASTPARHHDAAVLPAASPHQPALPASKGPHSAAPDVEPIFPPGAAPEVRSEAAKSLVKRLRGEVRERERRKRLAAEAEAEAIRVEMEQLDKLKAAREAAAENRKQQAKQARLEKANRRRQEVQSRLKSLNKGRRRDVHDPNLSGVHEKGKYGSTAGQQRLARANAEQGSPAAPATKWEWRPPAPVLPRGDPMAGGLAVAGMQLSGVSQSILATAAAVDSAVPALAQRKASLAALRANFDGKAASSSVSTPGSYYAPQLFGMHAPGSARFSEASSDGTKSRSGQSPSTSPLIHFSAGYVFDAKELPASISPSTKETPRMRAFHDAQPSRATHSALAGLPAVPSSAAQSQPPSRGSSARQLSPLQHPVRSHPSALAERAESSPARIIEAAESSRRHGAISPFSDASADAFSAIQALTSTAAQAQSALALDEASANRSKPLRGRARRPAKHAPHVCVKEKPEKAPSQRPVISPLQSPERTSSASRAAVPPPARQQFEVLGGWGTEERSTEDLSFAAEVHEQQTFAHEGEAHSTDSSHHSANEPDWRQATSPKPEQHRPPSPPADGHGDASGQSEQQPDTDSKSVSSDATAASGPSLVGTLAPDSTRPTAVPAAAKTERGGNLRVSQRDSEHLARRVAGEGPLVSKSSTQGPTLTELYAAAAELKEAAGEGSDSDEPEPPASAPPPAEDKYAGMSEEERRLAWEAEEQRARDIARNVDFLKVLAGDKRNLAAWNKTSTGPEQPTVSAFSGKGHSLGSAPATDDKQPSSPDRAAQERAAKARAARAAFFERIQGGQDSKTQDAAPGSRSPAAHSRGSTGHPSEPPKQQTPQQARVTVTTAAPSAEDMRAARLRALGGQ